MFAVMTEDTQLVHCPWTFGWVPVWGMGPIWEYGSIQALYGVLP